MDTQPLMSVTNAKSPTSQPAAIRNDNDSKGSDFDQHLQDQMNQADSGAGSAKTAEQAASQPETQDQTGATTADAANHSDHEGDEVEDVAEGVPAISNEPLEDTAILVNLDASPVTGFEQDLPQDGNVLPLLPVEAANTEVVDVGEGEVEDAKILQQIGSSELLEPGKARQSVLSRQNGSDLDGEGSKAVYSPELKPQIKSADEVSDKQVASLISEGGKTATISTQQVLSITGAAAVNIQNYVPPQLSAVQAQPLPLPGVFNGGISVPLTHTAWGNQVGDQLAFMIQGNVHSAEIKLNPAHLGPMEIHLSMKDHNASVTFVSAHAPVREALDAALPRLREMMEQQGLNLVNVDVSAHSGGRREAFGQQNNPAQKGSNEGQQDPVESAVTAMHTRIETGLSVFV